MIPGHETVGLVTELGQGVTQFNVGDRVGLSVFRKPCGTSIIHSFIHSFIHFSSECSCLIGICLECQRGLINYCPKIQLAGLTSHGGMAEYILADPKTTIKFPNELFESSQDPSTRTPLYIGSSSPTGELSKEDHAWTYLAPFMCAGSTVYNSLIRAGKMLDAVEELLGFQFNPEWRGVKKDAGRGRVVGIMGIGGLGHLGESSIPP
jgi:D-arabinose 1-dehydrogenase-like Zn-dependent alcohol dehydrogenase